MKTTNTAAASALAAIIAQITASGGDLDGAPCEHTPSGTDPARLYVLSRVCPWTGLRVFLDMWRGGVSWRSVRASGGATAFEGGPGLDAAQAAMPGIEVSLAPRDDMTVRDPVDAAAALKVHDARWPEWVPGRAGTMTLPGKTYLLRNRSTREWLRAERHGAGLRTKPWTRAPVLGSVFIGGAALDRALRGSTTFEAVAWTRANPRMVDIATDLTRALARVSA